MWGKVSLQIRSNGYLTLLYSWVCIEEALNFSKIPFPRKWLYSIWFILNRMLYNYKYNHTWLLTAALACLSHAGLHAKVLLSLVWLPRTSSMSICWGVTLPQPLVTSNSYPHLFSPWWKRTVSTLCCRITSHLTWIQGLWLWVSWSFLVYFSTLLPKGPNQGLPQRRCSVNAGVNSMTTAQHKPTHPFSQG
jgi:hypothetical protein